MIIFRLFSVSRIFLAQNNLTLFWFQTLTYVDFTSFLLHFVFLKNNKRFELTIAEIDSLDVTGRQSLHYRMTRKNSHF